MTFYFTPETFKVETFYSYPCCVVERISEYETRFEEKCGDNDIKEFFEEILKYAQEKTGKHLMDNKIAFKVTYKPTGSTFYVGYKDNIWCIGLALNPYMNSCYTLNIE